MSDAECVYMLAFVETPMLHTVGLFALSAYHRQIGRSSCGATWLSLCNDESETPRNRTGFGMGISGIRQHEFERLIAHIEPRVEAQRIRLGASRRPDSMKLADRKRLDKCRPHLRRDDVLAVWLAMIGSELCQELVVGDAGRSVEARYLLDFRTDRQRDVPRQWNALQIFGHIEVGLVQRQRDSGSIIACARRRSRVFAGRPPCRLERRLHEDQVWALSPRGNRWLADLTPNLRAS